MKAMTIMMFHVRVILTKIIIVCLAVPFGTAVLLLEMPRGRATWGQVLGLYSLKEWKRVWGTTVEAFMGCRWFIIDAPPPKWPYKLDRYTYWDDDDRLFCCLFLEDAVMLNLKVGGTLSKRPKTRNNNAVREDAL